MKKRTAIIGTLGTAGVLALGGAGITLAAAAPGAPGAGLGAVAAASVSGGTSTTYPAPGTHDDECDGDHQGGHDGDEVVPDDDWAAASAAALSATGAGTVTEVDADDDGDHGDHAWEVDVRLDSGAEVEVTLDAAFAVLGVQND